MDTIERCPNAHGCQVLHTQGFTESEAAKQFYESTYCSVTTANGYPRCKRFQTKKALGFCPDFVLPDSTLTLDEIMAKCEQ